MGFNYKNIEKVELLIKSNKSKDCLENILEKILAKFKWNDFIDGYNEIIVSFNTNKYQINLSKSLIHNNLYKCSIIPNMLKPNIEINNIYIRLKD